YISPGSAFGILPKRVVRKIVGEFQNPGAVAGKVKVDVPIPIGGTNRSSAQRQFYPPALQQAGVDIHGGITCRWRNARTEDLVFVFHHIVGSRKIEPMVKP